MVVVLTDLLRSLVSFDTTVNPDIDKMPDFGIIDYVRNILNSLGLRVEILESGGFRSIVGFLGSGKPRVLLMAHLDTVPFVRDEWRYDPLSLTTEGDLAYGRGALDDKGNVAAVIKALEGLRDVNNGTIVVAFTTDEEVGGWNGARVVRDYLLSNGLRPEFVINADGSGMVIINRRRAIFNLRVRAKARRTIIRGKPDRVRFELGFKVKPPYHAAYFMNGVDTHPMLALAQYITENKAFLTNLRGNFVKSNVTVTWVESDVVIPCNECPAQEVDLGLTNLVKSLIPLTRFVPRVKAQSVFGVTAIPNVYRRVGDYHEFVINVRAMTDDPDVIKEAARGAVAEDFPDVEVDVEAEGGGGYLYTPRNSKLVKTAEEVLRDLGEEPLVVEMAGASDARYFSPLGIETIDFGPIGGNHHGPNEYVSIKSLERTALFYEEVAKKLLSS